MTQPKTLAARRAPSSVKSEQRIKDILLVARQVFSERGYASATTIDMARRLGVSEATVFTYFSGKRDLCVRVICDWYDEIIAEIEATLPAHHGHAREVVFPDPHTPVQADDRWAGAVRADTVRRARERRHLRR